MRKTMLEARIFVKGRNLAYLVFCSLLQKTNVLNYGIGKMGFSNPQKGKENKKLKTV
jgi:hypothetical protein